MKNQEETEKKRRNECITQIEKKKKTNLKRKKKAKGYFQNYIKLLGAQAIMLVHLATHLLVTFHFPNKIMLVAISVFSLSKTIES